MNQPISLTIDRLFELLNEMHLDWKKRDEEKVCRMIASLDKDKIVKFTDKTSGADILDYILRLNSFKILKEMIEVSGFKEKLYETRTIINTTFRNMDPETDIAIFLIASRSRYMGLFRLIVQTISDLDINMCDENRRTLLMAAADGGNTQGVGLLLEKGADVNLFDKNGNNVLHYTIQDYSSHRYSNYRIAELLIEKGVNINQANRYGDTPLHIACSYGISSIAVLLLKNGACWSCKNHSYDESPLDIVQKEYDYSNAVLEERKKILEVINELKKAHVVHIVNQSMLKMKDFAGMNPKHLTNRVNEFLYKKN